MLYLSNLQQAEVRNKSVSGHYFFVENYANSKFVKMQKALLEQMVLIQDKALSIVWFYAVCLKRQS